MTLLGQVSRGCKTRKGSTGRDYYGFIRETKCPAVIAEYGFIDNAADRAKFDTAEECDAIGRAYARGILITLGVDVHAGQREDCDILREKLKFSEETIDYLLRYRYGDELVRRIADAVRG